MLRIKNQKLKNKNYRSNQIHTEIVIQSGTMGNVLTRKYLFIYLGIVFIILDTIAFLIGAKLVLPFFGIELLLLYISYQFEKYHSQKIETLLISDDQLIIHYGHAKGIWHKVFKSQSNDIKFQTYWTQIDFEIQKSQSPKVFAWSKGIQIEIGKLLPHNERPRLVDVLKSSLIF